MCGILAIFNHNQNTADKHRAQLDKLTHRGPDACGYYFEPKSYFLGHRRLAIMDPESGKQPFKTEKGTMLAVNGEIYNYKFLLKTYNVAKPVTKSDCEIIVLLFDFFLKEMIELGDENFKIEKVIDKVCGTIDGVFSFVIVYNDCIFAARDNIGVIPLYYGYNGNKEYQFASEMKAFDNVDFVAEFPPGHYFCNGEFHQMSHEKSNPWKNMKDDGDMSQYVQSISEYIPNTVYNAIKFHLKSAVEKRLMSDVQWGILLSGGLDSSVIAALAREILPNEEIRTFSIGLEGSPDIAAAEKVAEHLNTKHTSFTFTIEEALESLPKVIYHLETYDVTTIRAGTPMYLLAEKIKATGCKMVLSGEGSDEAFGGYMYFWNCPTPKEFFFETQRKLKDLHYYDCLRANKAMAAHGVECRVPFLDSMVLDYVMSINPLLKMPSRALDKIEKHILRKCFETYLPNDIVWRQKEQFSDGVGYNWIDSLQERSKNMVEWKLWENRGNMFPTNTPKTYEALYYRMIFEKSFTIPGASLLVPYGASCACSSDTAAKWKGNEVDDASGRSVKNHIKSTV